MVYLLNTYNPYIPWDTAIFEKAIAMFRYHIGVAFNVGFWIFCLLRLLLPTRFTEKFQCQPKGGYYCG